MNLKVAIEIKPDEYQRAAHQFATYGRNPVYPVTGLAEEAGEVAGKFAKYVRKHGGFVPMSIFDLPDGEPYPSEGGDVLDLSTFRADLAKELGDVCWMVAECATAYGLNLGEIMAGNIAKLKDRAERGVIVGEGDNR